MTLLPSLALRSFVGFDNLFNELETFGNQKQNLMEMLEKYMVFNGGTLMEWIK